jgi:hypothetical protein
MSRCSENAVYEGAAKSAVVFVIPRRDGGLRAFLFVVK